MKTNLRRIYNFNAVLVLVLGLTYFSHKYILEEMNISFQVNLLVGSYLINTILAAIIYSSLILLKKRYNEQIGFLFMFGSFLKFGAYFLFIHPHFNKDSDLSKLEFAMFFVPYIFSLILETSYLIKVLNSKD